ncbi:hypothetical protein KIPB_012609 [Kipferlia bialata]|uniref:Uncharacterized protein n=1 Tax=Kipferlia bialata TaxID=797122 RepID=A0A9K3GPN4_9EUKA|nr:hypothetical protein KIPB_012609 [Kipferlia bialata]|eukprot:g12609.t1
MSSATRPWPLLCGPLYHSLVCTTHTISEEGEAILYGNAIVGPPTKGRDPYCHVKLVYVERDRDAEGEGIVYVCYAGGVEVVNLSTRQWFPSKRVEEGERAREVMTEMQSVFTLPGTNCLYAVTSVQMGTDGCGIYSYGLDAEGMPRTGLWERVSDLPEYMPHGHYSAVVRDSVYFFSSKGVCSYSQTGWEERCSSATRPSTDMPQLEEYVCEGEMECLLIGAAPLCRYVAVYALLGETEDMHACVYDTVCDKWVGWASLGCGLRWDFGCGALGTGEGGRHFLIPDGGVRLCQFDIGSLRGKQ